MTDGPSTPNTPDDAGENAYQAPLDDTEETLRAPLPGTTPTPSLEGLSLPPEDLSGEWTLRGVPTLAMDGHHHPVLGRYMLISKIAKGGMGTVYYGVHQHLGTEVAVKVLLPNLGDGNDAVVKRFFREARLAAQLKSDHLVNVLDVAQDKDAGAHYLVMEYVHGLSAREWMEEAKRGEHGGLSEADALDLAVAAAKGLEAAHDRGIIHRDVKPANVLLPRDGTGRLRPDRAKVSDLGLARPVAAGATLTASEVALGTPGYMAPEQATDAKSARAPCDVFGLGATLYALLAGEAPFRGSTPFESLTATVQCKFQPLEEVRSDVSAATCDVVAKCLRKAPSDRFPDAAPLRRALETCRAALGGDGTVPAKPKPPTPAAPRVREPRNVTADPPGVGRREPGRSRNTLVVVLTSSLLVAALVVAGLAFIPTGDEPPLDKTAGFPPPEPADLVLTGFSLSAKGPFLLDGATVTNAANEPLRTGSRLQTLEGAVTVFHGTDPVGSLAAGSTARVETAANGLDTLMLTEGSVHATLDGSWSIASATGTLHPAAGGECVVDLEVGHAARRSGGQRPEGQRPGVQRVEFRHRCSAGVLILTPRPRIAGREGGPGLRASIPAGCELLLSTGGRPGQAGRFRTERKNRGTVEVTVQLRQKEVLLALDPGVRGRLGRGVRGRMEIVNENGSAAGAKIVIRAGSGSAQPMATLEPGQTHKFEFRRRGN